VARTYHLKPNRFVFCPFLSIVSFVSLSRKVKVNNTAGSHVAAKHCSSWLGVLHHLAKRLRDITPGDVAAASASAVSDQLKMRWMLRVYETMTKSQSDVTDAGFRVAEFVRYSNATPTSSVLLMHHCTSPQGPERWASLYKAR
jgi:hypothetical protein